MPDLKTSTPERSAARWGLLAGAVAASTWFIIGVLAAIVGLTGVTLGVRAIRTRTPAVYYQGRSQPTEPLEIPDELRVTGLR